MPSAATKRPSTSAETTSRTARVSSIEDVRWPRAGPRRNATLPRETRRIGWGTRADADMRTPEIVGVREQVVVAARRSSRTHLGLRVDDHVPDAQRDVLGGEGAKVVLARPHNRAPALQVQLAEAVPVLHELLEAKPKAAEVLSPLGVLLTLVERQQVCKQLAGAASGPRCK